MLAIGADLTAAAAASSKRPSLSVRLRQRTIAGVHRILPLAQVYAGAEPAGITDTVLTAAGTAISCRTDTTTVYVRRVTNPATATDWTQWASVVAGAVSGTPCAVATIGSIVALYYNSAGNTISYRISRDDGVTWDAAVTGLTLGAAMQRLAAAARPNAAGDMAGGVLLAVVAGPDVRAIAINTDWTLAGSSTSWGTTATAVSGVDVTYQRDFEAIITGSTASAEVVWGQVFGAGVQASAGSWSAAWVLDEAPATTTFTAPTIELVDGMLFFGYEEFRNTTVARRHWVLGHVPGRAVARWIDAEISEPSVVVATAGQTRRLAASSSLALLVSAADVRRSTFGAVATITEEYIERLKLELTPTAERATVVLDNDTPAIDSVLLQPGTELTIATGYDGSRVNYATLEVEEVSFTPQGREIGATGTYEALSRLRVRQARTFAAGSKTIYQLMALTLARAGLPAPVLTNAGSTPMTTATPAFALRPGETGLAVMRRLLAMVPEIPHHLLGAVRLTNPTAADATDYELGTTHEILDSRLTTRRPDATRTTIASQTGIDERFSSSYAHLGVDVLVSDRAASTSALLTAIGDRYVRHGDMSAFGGWVEIHTHPGLEVADVVSIVDARAGVTGTRRIRGILLERDARRSVWRERLTLSGV